MFRSLRLIAIATIILSMIGLGVIAGLFLIVNDTWVPVTVPPRLAGYLNEQEIWLPALIGGWLAAALLLAALVLSTMFTLWRRRQYESLVNRLERELAELRNLPFTEPAPLEDLPETPSAQAARVMHALDDESYDAP